MIHSNTTTLCINTNQEISMTSRIPQIISKLKAYNIEFARLTEEKTNELIENIPNNGYLDYEIFKQLKPLDVPLHYHEGAEARLVLHGKGTFTFPINNTEVELQVIASDYVVIPNNMPHSFKTDGDFEAIRLFTNHNGYVAHYC